MSSDVEKALSKFSEIQERQISVFSSMKEDVKDTKESVNRLSIRLENISERSIRSSEKVKYLEIGLLETKTTHKAERDLIWKGIRTTKTEAISDAQRNVMLKIYGSMVVSFTALTISLSKTWIVSVFKKIVP